MTVPDYQSLMLPTLETLADGKTRTSRELREIIADRLQLSDADRRVLLGSGKQTVLANRVAWAVTYLAKARVVDRPKRGTVQIAQRGRDLLAGNPVSLGIPDLLQFEEFRTFRALRHQTDESRQSHPAVATPENPLTPDEQIEAIVAKVNSSVADELVARVYAAGGGHGGDGQFLEALSLRLLQAMGYGGKEGRFEATGGPGDAGLDGIIHQDALGLDLVGVQAKSYEPGKTITRQDVQSFVGALQGAQTQRGVFITTARFSSHAHDYARSVNVRLVLIDGQQLAHLMIRYGLGVTVRETFDLIQVSDDFFDE